jgi:hypothetical protein
MFLYLILWQLLYPSFFFLSSNLLISNLWDTLFYSYSSSKTKSSWSPVNNTEFFFFVLKKSHAQLRRWKKKYNKIRRQQSHELWFKKQSINVIVISSFFILSWSESKARSTLDGFSVLHFIDLHLCPLMCMLDVCVFRWKIY